MRDNRRTISEKLAIVQEAAKCNNIRSTARKYKCLPSQIRRWRSASDKLRKKAQTNPSAKSVHAGRSLENSDVEDQIYEWILDMRRQDIGITTNQIILYALSIAPEFHQGSLDKLKHWIYPYLSRRHLSIRAVTHEGQKLSGHLRSVRDDVVKSIMKRLLPGGTLSQVTPHFFVNMDETAVYFESKLTRTVHETGARTVSLRCSGSNSNRITVCLSVAEDGTKLPLFLVFKAGAGKQVERGLHTELPDGVYGCCQDNGWMDERSTLLWIEKIWKPYVEGSTSSLLLLDEFRCHQQSTTLNALGEFGTDVEFIPGGYTSVLQPCDVGVNKPFKLRLRQLYTNWSIEKFRDLAPTERVPVPGRREVASWLKIAWDELNPEAITNTFSSIGFNRNQGVEETSNEPELEITEGDEFVELD